MKTGPFITSVEYTAYEFTAHNLGKDYNTFNMVYEPDGRLTQSGGIIQIHTDQGITGEYPIAGGPTREQVAMGAQYLKLEDLRADNLAEAVRLQMPIIGEAPPHVK